MWKIFKHIFKQMNKVLLFTLFVTILNCLSLQQHTAWSNKLTLKFDYAPDQSLPLQKNKFVVSWNGAQVKQIVPKDYYTTAVKFQVVAIVGENILNFVGKNVQIDNVELIRKGKCGKEDVLVNGDFSDGYKGGKPTNMGLAIPGWRSSDGGNIEIGYGRNYNKYWQNKDPVVKFSQKTESDIYQSVVFNENFEQVSDEQPK